jgi:hypothetical protein
MPTASAAPVKPTEIVEIERLGFAWTEVAQYDLTKLSTDRRIQVRETPHYAPKESVERYAIQMGQSQFPPIIVTSDGWIVDGNTRIGAAAKREAKFFPALVLDVAFAGRSTTSKQKNELVALAATLNAQNGVPLTARETREITATFIGLGWKAEQIARAIGLKPSGVTAVKKEIDAAAKLARVGMDANGAVKGASLRALGAKEVLALNDVPFKALATLAADAGLNASEIVTAAKGARETGSDTGQVQMFEDLRTEFGDRISERRLTGVGKPPVSRQLRQHLGFVTKFVGREQELIETDPKVSETHSAALTTAIAVLTDVLEMQAPR